MAASAYARDSIIPLLLARSDVVVKLVDSGGWSALVLAATSGREAVVPLIPNTSPDVEVNLVDPRGWSALMLASITGSASVVALLLAHPTIDVNLVANDRAPVLFMAISSGHEAFVVFSPMSHIVLSNGTAEPMPCTAMTISMEKAYSGIVRLLEEFEPRATREPSDTVQLAVEEAVGDEEGGNVSDSDGSETYHDAKEDLEKDMIR
jgi:Ankyrin repeat